MRTAVVLLLIMPMISPARSAEPPWARPMLLAQVGPDPAKSGLISVSFPARRVEACGVRNSMRLGPSPQAPGLETPPGRWWRIPSCGPRRCPAPASTISPSRSARSSRRWSRMSSHRFRHRRARPSAVVCSWGSPGSRRQTTHHSKSNLVHHATPDLVCR